MISKNEKLSSLFNIRTVIKKVNINNMFMNENKCIQPNLLSYSTSGFSQFTVLDSYGNFDKEIDESN